MSLGTATFAPGVRASDWREAVRAAGVDLVHARAVGPGYVDAMVQLVEDAGPYCVVAPGVAVPHAAPSALVRQSGLAIVTLDEPVVFGHPHNDPVRAIVAVASVTPAEHIRTLAHLANALDREGAPAELAAATTLEGALRVLEPLDAEAAHEVPL